MPHAILIMLMMALLPLVVHADIFVQTTVPNGMLEVDGNTSSRYPFYNSHYETNFPMRYQQVHDASQFSIVPTNGAFITFIMFRTDCSSGRNPNINNLQVRLSTTQKTPATLSTVFSNNIGLDESLVFAPTNIYFPPHANPCPQPQAWAGFTVSTPFYYNPSKGNLLMEIRHTGMGRDPFFDIDYRIDAHTASSNTAARVYATSQTATTGTNDGLAMVTLFQFDTAPQLYIYQNTNTVNVLVLTYVPDYRVQTTTQLGPSAQWQDYTGNVERVTGGIIARFPGVSFQQNTYIRAILERPPPP